VSARRGAWAGLGLSGGVLVAAAAALLAWPGPGGADVGSLAELGPEVEDGAGGPQPTPAPLPRPAALRIADVPDLAAALPRESPLAARVGTRSARPEDLPRRRVRQPRRMHVPALGVRAPVVAVGVRGRAREVALPASARRVAWYRFGPHPGARGTAVLAAHADWQGRPGPFVRLTALGPGDRVRVGFRRGEARAFRVIARRSYDKERLPRRLFATAGRPALALVTCGGPFDRRTRTYARNTVVWAVPA